ncbi:hypothetical protein CYMTET_33601, partial [Cymbomonas tetramitiformis]
AEAAAAEEDAEGADEAPRRWRRRRRGPVKGPCLNHPGRSGEEASEATGVAAEEEGGVLVVDEVEAHSGGGLDEVSDSMRTTGEKTAPIPEGRRETVRSRKFTREPTGPTPAEGVVLLEEGAEGGGGELDEVGWKIWRGSPPSDTVAPGVKEEMRGETVVGASSDDLQGKPADVGDEASIQRASNLVNVVLSGQEEAVFRGDTEGVSGACRPGGEGREESLLNKSEGLKEQGVNICRIKTGSGCPGVEASADCREEVGEGEGNRGFEGEVSGEEGEETGPLHARKVGNVRDEGGVGCGEVKGTIKLSEEATREGGGAGARKGEGEVREGDKGFCPLAVGDDGEVKRGVVLSVDGQRGKGRAGGSNGCRKELGESERVNGRGEEQGGRSKGGERRGRGKEKREGKKGEGEEGGHSEERKRGGVRGGISAVKEAVGTEGEPTRGTRDVSTECQVEGEGKKKSGSANEMKTGSAPREGGGHHDAMGRAQEGWPKGAMSDVAQCLTKVSRRGEKSVGERDRSDAERGKELEGGSIRRNARRRVRNDERVKKEAGGRRKESNRKKRRDEGDVVEGRAAVTLNVLNAEGSWREGPLRRNVRRRGVQDVAKKNQGDAPRSAKGTDATSMAKTL